MYILGDNEIEEDLVLQQAAIVNDDRLVTYADLPRIRITAELAGGRKLFCSGPPVNIMSFTLESMYNTPRHFTEDLKYAAATLLPITDDASSRASEEKIKSAQAVGLAPFRFEHGMHTTSQPTSAMYKRWHNLYGQEENASKYTTQEVVLDETGVRNQAPNVNLQTTMLAPNPRIVWNVIRSCSLAPVELDNNVKYKMMRNRCWPLEFYVSPGGFPATV